MFTPQIIYITLTDQIVIMYLLTHICFLYQSKYFKENKVGLHLSFRRDEMDNMNNVVALISDKSI